MPERAIKSGLTQREFKQRLDDLIADKPMKIWLLKSVMGRVDVLFSAGDAQGKPIRNFDHLGGFYLMGENIPPEHISQIHLWFVEFTKENFTAHRLDRHFVDVRYHRYQDEGKKYREELVMHVPLSVHSPMS